MVWEEIAGRTDGGDCNIPDAFLKKRGDNKQYKAVKYLLQQTACFVVNPITVGNFAFLFNCTPVGRTSDSMMVPT